MSHMAKKGRKYSNVYKAMNFFQRLKNRIVTNIQLTSLGDRWHDKLMVFVFSFWFPIKKRIGVGLSVQKGKKIRLKKFGRPFLFIVRSGLDFEVLREVFIKEEYACDIAELPHTIFDLGSNIGASVAYFALKYPAANIFAFEPDPNNIPYLKRNTAQFERVRQFPYAVTDNDSDVILYADSEKSLSSSIMLCRSGQKRVNVVGRSLDSLIDEFSINKIDLLKFDIEGAELKVFSSFTRWDIFRCIVGEVHLDLMKGSLGELKNILSSFHVNLTKLSEHRYILFAVKK